MKTKGEPKCFRLFLLVLMLMLTFGVRAQQNNEHIGNVTISQEYLNLTLEALKKEHKLKSAQELKQERSTVVGSVYDTTIYTLLIARKEVFEKYNTYSLKFEYPEDAYGGFVFKYLTICPNDTLLIIGGERELIYTSKDNRREGLSRAVSVLIFDNKIDLKYIQYDTACSPDINISKISVVDKNRTLHSERKINSFQKSTANGDFNIECFNEIDAWRPQAQATVLIQYHIHKPNKVIEVNGSGVILNKAGGYSSFDDGYILTAARLLEKRILDEQMSDDIWGI